MNDHNIDNYIDSDDNVNNSELKRGVALQNRAMEYISSLLVNNKPIIKI